MPNEGPEPKLAQRELFTKYLDGHPGVLDGVEITPGTFTIRNKKGTRVRVRLVEIYTVSEADVLDKLADDPGLGAIVTASAWNSVSPQAASYGAQRDVKVLGWTEFFGWIGKA